jgi:hypothetical protein
MSERGAALLPMAALFIWQQIISWPRSREWFSSRMQVFAGVPETSGRTMNSMNRSRHVQCALGISRVCHDGVSSLLPSAALPGFQRACVDARVCADLWACGGGLHGRDTHRPHIISC